MSNNWFSSVKIPESNFLRRKESFEYTTPLNVYDIDLFHNQNGSCYAVGVPREGRVIVYGSAVVEDASLALQTVVDKIHREGMETKDSKQQTTGSDD